MRKKNKKMGATQTATDFSGFRYPYGGNVYEVIGQRKDGNWDVRLTELNQPFQLQGIGDASEGITFDLETSQLEEAKEAMESENEDFSWRATKVGKRECPACEEWKKEDQFGADYLCKKCRYG